MDNNEMEKMTIESAKSVHNDGFIDDDLVLFNEIADVPLPCEPRRMDCLLLALCKHGKAEYSVDTIKHTVCAGDIIIIGAGQVTDDYLLSRDCSGTAIMISEPFFQEIVAGVHELSSLFIFSRMHPVFHLSQQEQANILEFLHFINQKINDTSQHFRRDIVRTLLQTLIYEAGNIIWRISKDTTDVKRTRAETIFIRFIELLEQHFREKRRVGWYGLQLGITPKYLSETVKQVSHQSPNEWIDYYVTLELRVQLKNTTKTIREITDELHFPNQSFLGKYFKEHVGMSPSEFRKQL